MRLYSNLELHILYHWYWAHFIINITNKIAILLIYVYVHVCVCVCVCVTRGTFALFLFIPCLVAKVAGGRLWWQYHLSHQSSGIILGWWLMRTGYHTCFHMYDRIYIYIYIYLHDCFISWLEYDINNRK